MAPTYPARLDGRLEEPINRLLWLVKWALLIPHFICLLGLWIAMSVLTRAADPGIPPPGTGELPLAA